MSYDKRKRQKEDDRLEAEDMDFEIEMENIEKEDQQTEDLNHLSTDDLCRRFLPVIPKISDKLDKVGKILRKQQDSILSLKREVKGLKQEVVDLKDRNEKLHNRVNINNLILSGLVEDNENTVDKDYQKVSALFKSKLGFEPNIDKVERLGMKKNELNSKPRLLKIKFLLTRERDIVMSQKRKLGHPYCISADLTPEQQAVTSKLIKHAKLARSKGKLVDILWKSKQIKIEGVIYNIEDDLLVIAKDT